MSRFEAWLLHLSNLLVGGTGLVYAWMRYWAEPLDPFAVVNHPWQPTVQHLHLLAAPLLVFATAFTLKEHAWRHVRLGIRARRKSGWTLLLTLVPMVASGYLIQTTVTEGWRQAWVAIHLISSGLWLLGYGAHLLARRRNGRHPTEPAPPPA